MEKTSHFCKFSSNPIFKSEHFVPFDYIMPKDHCSRCYNVLKFLKFAYLQSSVHSDGNLPAPLGQVSTNKLVFKDTAIQSAYKSLAKSLAFAKDRKFALFFVSSCAVWYHGDDVIVILAAALVNSGTVDFRVSGIFWE